LVDFVRKGQPATPRVRCSVRERVKITMCQP
jgi:hypothetical protein